MKYGINGLRCLKSDLDAYAPAAYAAHLQPSGNMFARCTGSAICCLNARKLAFPVRDWIKEQ